MKFELIQAMIRSQVINGELHWLTYNIYPGQIDDWWKYFTL